MLVLICAACGEKKGDSWGIEYEDALLKSEIDKIDRALSTAEELKIDPARNPHQKYYSAAFGENPEGRVLYMDDRINYIAAPFPQMDPAIGAVNPSFAFWMSDLRGQPLDLTFNGKLLVADSTRLGLIILGPACVDSSSRVLNMDILIHEGRHSDCPGGLSASDVALIRGATQAEFEDGKVVLSNQNCGFRHTNCPAELGPDLAGLPACENQVWGPYALETLHSLSLVKACTNCSSIDQEHARIIAIDTELRVEKMGELLSGDVLPDMSTQKFAGQ
jgi:hypothetical protein